MGQGKEVYGKLSLHIRSRSNHRRRPQQFFYAPGPGIGTSHMAGEQGNDITPCRVHTKNRRIRQFIPDKGRYGPYTYAGRTYKQQRPALGKGLPGKGFHPLFPADSLSPGLGGIMC